MYRSIEVSFLVSQNIFLLFAHIAIVYSITKRYFLQIPLDTEGYVYTRHKVKNQDFSPANFSSLTAVSDLPAANRKTSKPQKCVIRILFYFVCIASRESIRILSLFGGSICLTPQTQQGNPTVRKLLPLQI